MKPTGTPKMLFALAAALLVVPLGALAQEEYASVRNLEGSAQVVGARETQPQDLTLNTPLMEGDTLWTSRSGRLDLFLQDGNHVWLDYDSRLEITQIPTLDPSARRTLQARLWKGSALLDIQADPVGGLPYWIVTPSTTVTTLDRGLYLIEVENVDRTRVTALEGRCDVASSGQTVRLERMQMTYSEYGYAPTPARGAGALPAATLLAFRDDHLPRPTHGGDSRRYLPESLSAYSADFDNYGTWNYAANYGYVWRPSPSYISVGWAPYRNGRWCYRPWGVTWIPFEPWGWCHSHFGRWIFMAGLGWGWVPGHIFSPAWVSWYWGDGWIGWSPWGWDNSWGNYGWCSVNITNLYVTNVTTVIVNHNGPPPVPPISRPGPLPLQRPAGEKQGMGEAAHGVGALGGIHLSPGDIDDYRNGRVDLAGLRRKLDGPSGISTGPASGPGLRPSSDGLGSHPGALSRPGAGSDGSLRPGNGGNSNGSRPDPLPRVEPPPRSQPGTRPAYEPPTSSPRPELSPKVEPSPRNQPGTRPTYEPPSPSPRPEPTPWQESSPRPRPNERPSYEPPSSPSRPEPTPWQGSSPRPQPNERPSYEPPSSSSRPEPTPWREASPRSQPSERPSYEPPASHDPPRTVPSRVEPKPAPAPSPAPSSPPASSGGARHKSQDKDQHRRGFGRG